MSHTVALAQGFVIHTRQYRESSLLLDVITRDHGRVALISKGARRPRSPLKGLLQPFVPLLLSWVGKSDLQTLTQAESQKPMMTTLISKWLYSGLYLNELTMRLLSRGEGDAVLFDLYQQTIHALSLRQEIEPLLRYYEYGLLCALGYGIGLDSDFDSGEPVDPDAYYEYWPERGMRLSHLSPTRNPKKIALFKGDELLALESQQLSTPESLRSVKILMRLMLNPLLEGRPLKTRALFA